MKQSGNQLSCVSLAPWWRSIGKHYEITGLKDSYCISHGQCHWPRCHLFIDAAGEPVYSLHKRPVLPEAIPGMMSWCLDAKLGQRNTWGETACYSCLVAVSYITGQAVELHMQLKRVFDVEHLSCWTNTRWCEVSGAVQIWPPQPVALNCGPPSQWHYTQCGPIIAVLLSSWARGQCDACVDIKF